MALQVRKNIKQTNKSKTKNQNKARQNKTQWPHHHRPIYQLLEHFEIVLILYSRAYGSYHDFLNRGLLLTRKLLNQGFLLVKLKSSLRKFQGRHHNLVDRYGISGSQMSCKHFTVLSSFNTYHQVCNQINTTVAISGARTAHPSGTPDFNPCFQWGSCYLIFSFMYVLQIVVCPFVLFLLSIVLILITPLVSSNSSDIVIFFVFHFNTFFIHSL